MHLKKYIPIIVFTLLCTATAMAQPEEPDAPTPFGFVELLIGAGALYGGRKVYNRKVEQK